MGSGQGFNLRELAFARGVETFVEVSAPSILPKFDKDGEIGKYRRGLKG
jgi:hypothetical protein